MAMISLFNPMHYLIQLFHGSAVKLLLQPLTKLLHLLLSGEVLGPFHTLKYVPECFGAMKCTLVPPALTVPLRVVTTINRK